MGIGLSEEIIDELREENIKNFEDGVIKDVPVFYIDSTPFKSDNLKSRVFSKQGLRGDKIKETIEPEARSRMELMAEMNQVIYDRRKAFGRNFFSRDERRSYKDIANQDVKDYKFIDIESDLTGLFKNDEKKEIIIATRGILPTFDRKDTLQTLPMVRDFLFEKQKPESFGEQFKRDRKMLDEVYRKVKVNYPDYRVVVTGHSRGGQGTVYLGRKHNLEYHAFSPVGNRADYIDSVPVLGGNIYYHTKDPVSFHFHKRRGKTIEQHYELFNTRIYPHSTKDFFDGESIVVKHPKLSQAEQLGLEEEILLDIKTKPEDVITPEEFVLSDLGIFEEDYVSRDDPKHKNTIALNGDDPSNRKIFTEYVPSVFNDLNLKPSKKFIPMNFSEIDSDKNQKISYKEFENFFLKKGFSKNDILELFKTYDIDGDKSIDREEFNELTFQML